jgi:protein-export membrane protein SecD
MIFIFNKENILKIKENGIHEKLGKNYQILVDEKKNLLKISFDDNYLNFLKSSALKESIKNISKRIDSLGNKEITTEILGRDKILLQAPGFDNPERLKYLVGKTGKLTLHIVDDEQKINDVFYKKDERGFEIRLVKNPILDGKALKNAYANLSQNGDATVHFSLNKEGSEAFSKITGENIGKRIAILIDDQVLSAPLIREKISGGAVEISGSFNYEEASNLASSLRSGALPIRLFISEERLVGAAAGDELIRKGCLALSIALILVSVFMIFIYGALGFVASFGILLNLFLIICVMIFSESVLSLAGIAGLVLTVGIIVDNNVLIFERIREELSSNNKAYVRSIQNGFDRAIITITDSNLTTIISASLLFAFGDSNIKGFALTLIYGIIISFFSTIWVSRIIIENFDAKILKKSFFLSFLEKKFNKKNQIS